MTTSETTIAYILDQLTSVSNVRVRKMFGDYALYCNDKVVGLVCNDQLFIKFTESGKTYAEEKYTEGIAYPGAKPSMNVTEYIEDTEFICTLVQITADTLPIPKKRKHG